MPPLAVATKRTSHTRAQRRCCIRDSGKRIAVAIFAAIVVVDVVVGVIVAMEVAAAEPEARGFFSFFLLIPVCATELVNHLN
jgi:hypothetical protein